MWVGAIVTWWCKPQDGEMKLPLVLSCENVSPVPLRHPEIWKHLMRYFSVSICRLVVHTLKKKKIEWQEKYACKLCHQFVTCEWILAFKKFYI